MNSGFETIDFIIFGVYIVVLVALGLFLSRDKDGKEKSANDYFLAGNTLTWWAVGASLIAANISAEQFIGMSASASSWQPMQQLWRQRSAMQVNCL